MTLEEIGQVGVVGAGLMGHGIALSFAVGGYEVSLTDASEEALERAMDNVAVTLGVLGDEGLVDEATANAVPGRIQADTSLENAMADVGFVVEAVFEDLDLKRRVFAELDRHCPPRAVLASNTSSYMASQLAPATNRPDRGGRRQLVESTEPAAAGRDRRRATDQR